MAEVVEISESRWFKIVVFVISGFFVGFSLANIIYFNRIRRNGGGDRVTRGEATSMLWVNAILFAIALIVFIWSIFRLVAGREYRQRVGQYFQEPGTGFVEAPATGAPVPRLRRSQTVVHHETTAPQATAPRVPPRTTAAPPGRTTRRTTRTRVQSE